MSAALRSQISLASLAKGQRARIARVACDRSIALRLMEMGLLAGTTVEHVRVAPLGDPLEFRVRGYFLSIRKSEAELVLVEPVMAPQFADGSEPTDREQDSSRVRLADS